MKSIGSDFNCVFNYCINKFCPLIVIGVLLVLKMGYETWEPYAVMALVLFVGHFNFKVGYAVATCESKGLLPKDGDGNPNDGDYSC